MRHLILSATWALSAAWIPCLAANSIAVAGSTACPLGGAEEVTEEDRRELCWAVETDACRARPCGDGFLARNERAGWVTTYDGDGATTVSRTQGWSWGLALRSWGFAGGETLVDRACRVTSDGQRVSLHWDDGLTEWWIQDARGLEHGFTVEERRTARAETGPLRFTLDILGGSEAVIASDGRSARFVWAEGAHALTYAGLVAYDADGQRLCAWMEAEGSTLALCVDETGARYPLTIDPLVQAAYVKASNTGSADRFGWSVDISGNTAVVGAFVEGSSGTGVDSGTQADNSAPGAGAAYVFVRDSGTWTQEAYLKASNTEEFDGFGVAVAISGDTIVVGAYDEDGDGVGVNSGAQATNGSPDSGAAYVFQRMGTTWSQEAYLKASNTGAFERFGSAVSIAGDTIAVGAEREGSDGQGVNGSQSNDNAPDSGAVYVFRRAGATWSQDAYLKASNAGGGDRFGSAVAVSGETVLVGASGESSDGTGSANDSAPSAGAAYVFERSAGTWTEQAYLKASNADASDEFGHAASITKDTLAIGAPLEASSGTGVNGGGALDNSLFAAGAAYVFRRSGSAWQQEAYVKASNTDGGDLFGWSVDLANGAMVVGARFESSGGVGVDAGMQADNSIPGSGAAYLFQRTGATWSQRNYVKASNPGSDDNFGTAASVSGGRMIVSGPREDGGSTGINGPSNEGASLSGAVYVYDAPLGANYCDAVAGASGIPAMTSAEGSDLASDNEVTLMASGLPPFSFAFFLTSDTTGFVMNAGGSLGNLCLGGAIGRYVGPGQLQQSGSAGTIALTLDLAQHPTPGGFVQVQPGETWYFTAWFRDVMGGVASSNFSDGLSIEFR